MKNPKFIALQGSYLKLQLALFDSFNLIQKIEDINKKASSSLIPHLDQILNNNSLSLNDINFICVDQGPGAFTSLRVTISTVNGLGFANKIPLIGIDGLDALSNEAFDVYYKEGKEGANILVSILNAYNNDVYYSINKISGNNLQLAQEFEQPKGYKKIDLLLEDLKTNFKDQKILFVGNAVQLHKELIELEFGNIPFTLRASETSVSKGLLDNLPEISSVQQIAKMGLKKWQQTDKENYCYKLYPLYLKSQSFAITTRF